MKQNNKASIFSGLIPRLILTAIFGGVYFYVMLPAINLKAPDFWAFLIILVLFYIFITLLTSGARMYAGGNVIFMGRTDTVTGKITEIRTVVVDGNTIFYFQLGSDVYYAVSAADDQDAVIFDVGDRVTITYYVEEETNGVYTGIKVE